MARKSDTADRILDLAEVLVQQRGFNGFSYQDIADALQVRKASLHYHFPSKAALGAALIERYSRTVLGPLADPKSGRDPWRTLDGFFSVFRTTAEHGDRVCLAGVLAAEYGSLPGDMHGGLQRFFRDGEAWLGVLLAKGRKDGAFCFDGSPRDRAQAMVAALEGALVIGRTRDPSQRLETVIQVLKDQIACPS